MSETDIRALDDRTVERIAAGEVVERPASVVKELVENALDADASRVDVAVEDGGVDGVVVRDDGQGMTATDVRAAVREHTTSKIRDVEDLEAGVATLGFRGEALHTIGAVSRTTIRTRTAGEDTGTELVYEGGEVASVEPTGCPKGTTVEVRDLFYNTPAREKYLKTTPTEFAHVNRVVRSYALANPDVAVTLEHDGREVFATPGRGDRRATVMAVYGREVAEAMHAVDDVDVPEGPLDDVTGLVSDPETNRSAREYVSVFVNGRAVSASAVREAVLEAYGGQLDADRYPFTALFLDVPAGDVDVNVHPRKMEVRFADEAAMKRQVRDAVRETLLDAGLVRSSAPRGRSKPAETDVSPTTASDLADDGEATGGAEDAPGGDGGRAAADATPGARDAGTDTSDAPADGSGATVDESSAVSTDVPAIPDADDPVPDASDPVDDPATRADHGGGADAVDAADDPATGDAADAVGASTVSGVDDGASAASTAGDAATGTDEGGAGGDAGEPDAPATGGSRPSHAGAGGEGSGDSRRFGGGLEQRTLGGDAATPAGEYDRLPSLRVLGQYRDTYLVAETDDGLVLVDQHAADERVNYERLRAAFAEDATAQALAEPVTLELTAGEAEAFPAYRDALATLGFHAERTGEGGDAGGAREVTVTTVPAVFDETLDPEDVRDVLSGFVASDDDGAATVDALADAFVADLACYPSVTANTSLREGSVVELLEALDDCENPFACPHGRPTVVRLDHADLEGRFERDYPGHGGRREV